MKLRSQNPPPFLSLSLPPLFLSHSGGRAFPNKKLGSEISSKGKFPITPSAPPYTFIETNQAANPMHFDSHPSH